jgi:hypothetical protein
MAAPFLEDYILDHTKIIHIVRNPLQVISSFCLDLNFFEKSKETQDHYRCFVYSQLPDLYKISDPIERGAYYYVKWNEMIEQKKTHKPYMLFNVERGVSMQLLDFLGVDRGLKYKAFSNNRINSWRRRREDITLKDIPKGSIKNNLVAIAERYGYHLTPLL